MLCCCVRSCSLSQRKKHESRQRTQQTFDFFFLIRFARGAFSKLIDFVCAVVSRVAVTMKRVCISCGDDKRVFGFQSDTSRDDLKEVVRLEFGLKRSDEVSRVGGGWRACGTGATQSHSGSCCAMLFVQSPLTTLCCCVHDDAQVSLCSVGADGVAAVIPFSVAMLDNNATYLLRVYNDRALAPSSSAVVRAPICVFFFFFVVVARARTL